MSVLPGATSLRAGQPRQRRCRSIAGSLIAASLVACFISNARSDAATNAPASATTRPALASAPATDPSLTKFDYHAIKFGSDFNLYFYAPDKATADAAAAAVFARIDALDPVLNDYSPDSEISRLSRLAHDGPMTRPAAVSDDLFAALSLGRHASVETDGTFDVTIGPSVQLWRWSRRQQMLPSPEKLAEAKAAVGWRHLELDPDGPPAAGQPHQVRLSAAKMRLDVGGIAGGLSADDALGLLRRRGITRALVDSSGDLSVGDPPPGKSGWVVAVRDLSVADKTADYVQVANCGVSTSGDTYRFVLIDGVRYSHIVDPATGLGLTHRVGVTTIAPDGKTADWLATTLSVLGPDKAMGFINRYNRAHGGGAASPAIGARITSLDANGRAKIVESERYKQVEKVLEPATNPSK